MSLVNSAQVNYSLSQAIPTAPKKNCPTHLLLDNFGFQEILASGHGGER